MKTNQLLIELLIWFCWYLCCIWKVFYQNIYIHQLEVKFKSNYSQIKRVCFVESSNIRLTAILFIYMVQVKNHYHVTATLQSLFKWAVNILNSLIKNRDIKVMCFIDLTKPFKLSVMVSKNQFTFNLMLFKECKHLNKCIDNSEKWWNLLHSFGFIDQF